MPNIAELEQTLSRPATALIDACLRRAPTEQHAVSEALARLTARDAPAVVGGGGRLKLIVKWRSEVAYVWAYGMLAIPGSKQAVVLLGRQWLNDLSTGRLIHIPSELSGEEFANSYAGGQLFLPCKTSPYFWESAIVTDPENASDDPRHPPRMWGCIKALDIDSKSEVRLQVGKFKFEDDPGAEIVEPDIDYLSAADAEILRLAIKRYKTAPSGVFRPDRIKLSGPGRRLINSFLFLFFRNEYAKSSTVNFSVLLNEKPKIKSEFSIRTTDHYISRSEKWTENNKSDLYFTYVLVYNYHELLARPISGAGLEQQLKHLVDLHGFQHVANILFWIAPPEKRALATGMVSAEYPQAASSLTAKPTLSDVDRAAFLEASATSQWSAAGGLAPSKFMQKHFGQWFDRGLTIDDISAEQPSLVADYKNEILHNPRKRIRALTRAHKLPAGTQRSPAYKLVAELSEAELATVREQRMIAKRASRKRKKDGDAFEYSQDASSFNPKSLSDVDRAAFLEASDTHPWSLASGVAPSRHIVEHFRGWFDRGLTIDDIANAQPDLIAEYKIEIVHNTRKRIKALSRPHRLPAGAKRPLNARLAAELTPDELRAKRDSDNVRKRKSRKQSLQ